MRKCQKYGIRYVSIRKYGIKYIIYASFDDTLL